MNPTVNTNKPIAIIVSKNKLEQDKLFDLLNSFNLSLEEFNILLFLSYLFVIDPIIFVSYFNWSCILIALTFIPTTILYNSF